MDTTKALLLLDVDGPLNPWAAPPHKRPEGYQSIWLTNDNKVLDKKQAKEYKRARPKTAQYAYGTGKPKLTLVWYNPAHGQSLLDLEQDGFVVTWATKWNDLANTILSPLYDLPQLPVATVSTASEKGCHFSDRHYKGCSCLHSKTKTLLDYADGLPFVWVDDEVTKRDVAFLKENATQPHLVYPIDPRYGLTDKDFAYLKDWVASL